VRDSGRPAGALRKSPAIERAVDVATHLILQEKKVTRTPPPLQELAARAARGLCRTTAISA